MAKKRRSVDNTGRNGRNTSRYSERTATNRLGSFCLVFQALVSIVFMIVVILLDMLPIVFSVVYCVYNTGCKEKARNRREDFQPVDDLCADIRRLQHRSGE